MSADARLRVLLVDPSLFTAPYDAALSEGLVAADVAPCWAIRPTREGDRAEIAPEHVALLFYTRVDGIQRGPARLRAVAKGLAHVAGLARLLRWVYAQRPDVVHFQWAVVPWLDTLAMRLLRRWCPVLLTVHDTTPFNGERATRWQSFAVDAPLAAADRLIVHTRSARTELLRRGFASDDVALIPHGPLRLGAAPSQRALERSDARHTFVLFGELKHYKGLDVLVEALGRLPEGLRCAARVIIAGRPRMDLEPLRARIAGLGLSGCVELHARRLSEQEMADLFAGADAFVFPYRQVDASGVYFLVKACSKWIIASDLGIFAEDVVDGVQGRLVPPENAAALSAAMAEAIQQRPQPAAVGSSAAWPAIGGATAQLYREALAARRLQPLPARWLARGAVSRIAALLVLGALAFVIIYWLERRAEPLSALDAVVSVAEAADTRGVAAAATSPAGARASAPVGFSAESGYRLAKDWDFRSAIRDERTLRAEFFTRYIYSGGTLDHLNDEWSRYRDAGNHVFSAEGLALTARVRSGVAANELAPGAIESGMLRSRWSGQYGVFEIRMKAPAGRGLWPAFWLNPQDGVWPPEIDVIEIVDNGRDSSRHGYHFVHGVDEQKAPLFSRLNASHAYAPGGDYSEAFHVFSVEWTPERVRHRVDGVLVVERAFRWLHADGKDAGPAHVLVNLAVGGRWPGPPAATALPARLVIDYIRAWQR